MEQTNGNRWERPDAPLGTLVYRAGLLSKDKLEAALEEGQRTGRRLGEILLQKGWIDEKDLARLLAGQRGLQFVSLKGRGYEIQAARLLPERLCRYHNAIPIELSGESILVAIADPTDDGANDEIRDELQRQVNFVVATASEIRSALDEVYGAAQAAQVAVAAAPTAISPIGGDHGLRIAAPAPLPEPEPAHVEPERPESEPVAAEPVLAPVPSPEPAIPLLPEVEAQPEPEPEPEAEAQPAPEPETAPAPFYEPLPVLPGYEQRAAGHEPELPEPAELPEPPEPTIERNEDAHVSVAFHPAPASDPVPAPESQPELAPEPAPEPAADSSHDAYRLVINLGENEEVDVALFADEGEAVAAARELVAGIAKDGEWPQVGLKFLPPDRIVSVEIREKAAYGGNSNRAGWGSGS